MFQYIRKIYFSDLTNFKTEIVTIPQNIVVLEQSADKETKVYKFGASNENAQYNNQQIMKNQNFCFAGKSQSDPWNNPEEQIIGHQQSNDHSGYSYNPRDIITSHHNDGVDHHEVVTTITSPGKQRIMMEVNSSSMANKSSSYSHASHLTVLEEEHRHSTDPGMMHVGEEVVVDNIPEIHLRDSDCVFINEEQGLVIEDLETMETSQVI